VASELERGVRVWNLARRTNRGLPDIPLPARRQQSKVARGGEIERCLERQRTGRRPGRLSIGKYGIEKECQHKECNQISRMWSAHSVLETSRTVGRNPVESPGRGQRVGRGGQCFDQSGR